MRDEIRSLRNQHASPKPPDDKQRHTKALIADLEASKKQVEKWSRMLEEKVQARTKDLEESQRATLNIMEDLNEEKEKVVKQAAELEKLNLELKAFSMNLEEKVKERTAELSILYEVSNSISYTLDYQTLLKLIMESLFKIVDYDICASLLFDARTAHITLKPAYAGSAGLLDEVKNGLIDATSALSGEDIRKKHLNVFFIPPDPNSKPNDNRQFDELRSFFNVPFIVRGKTIGMINVSCCQENAFSEDDIRLLYTIASQASNAIEGLRAVIAAEKSKMESMVKSMIEGVIMLDTKGEIVVLNPKARQILGFRLDEEVTKRAMNRKIKALSLPTAVEGCQGNGKKCLITKEITISQKNGKKKDIHCEVIPVKDENDKTIGIVTILRDITEEKEIDRMKTEFISTVSHELRTPLSITKEAISLILDKVKGDINEKQDEILVIAKNNIDRLARIINDLLDISKIEAGKVELKKTRADVVSMIKMVASAFESKAKEKGLKLKIKCPRERIDIYADEDKMIQIFTNLVDNAIKFTSRGFVEISTQERESTVECAVADTGIGFSREDLPKAFDRFKQFARVGGPGQKGTGLGLSIVKGIVDLHKGKIWVESEVGKGTKFTFSLPKLSSEEGFEQYLSEMIREAKEKEDFFSVITITIQDSKELFQEFPEKAKGILKKMEEVIKTSLRIRGDIVVKDTSKILVILPETKREGTISVLERIKEKLIQYLKGRKDLKGKINFATRVISYPEEGREEKDILNEISEAADG